MISTRLRARLLSSPCEGVKELCLAVNIINTYVSKVSKLKVKTNQRDDLSQLFSKIAKLSTIATS